MLKESTAPSFAGVGLNSEGRPPPGEPQNRRHLIHKLPVPGRNPRLSKLSS